MDVVALISVVSSAVVGLSGAGVSLYGVRRTATTARATQVRQRKADAYLEVLRLMEAKAQWVTASAENLKLNSDEEWARHFSGHYDRPVPEPPALGAYAVMKAHVAAFASQPAKEAFSSWLEKMEPIDRFFADLGFLVIEGNNGRDPDVDQIKPLLDALPSEGRARAFFAETVAIELRR